MPKLPAGTVKKDDGTLEKSFTMRGKTHRVTGATAEDLLAAEQLLREQLAEEARARSTAMTLDEYFELWIRRRSHTAKEASIYRYRRQYRTNLSPRLGRRRLMDISRGDVFALLQIDNADGVVIHGIPEQQHAEMIVLGIAVRACARKVRAARGLDVDVQVIHGRHLMSMVV